MTHPRISRVFGGGHLATECSFYFVLPHYAKRFCVLFQVWQLIGMPDG